MRPTPETAPASAGARHTQLTRAIRRGYHLTEPDQTHAARLLGSTFHGYISLEIVRDRRLDLALVRPAAIGPDLVSAPAVKEQLVAALSSTCALAKRQEEPQVRNFDGQGPLMHSPVKARYSHELLIRRPAPPTSPPSTRCTNDVRALHAMLHCLRERAYRDPAALQRGVQEG